MKSKKSLVNYCGLLGPVSLLSIMAAILFAPSAYPGYDWKSQAVSELSASGAPSALLWSQLASLYAICGLVSIMMACVVAQGGSNKPLRAGIYLFAAMHWVSGIGYAMFPLSGSDNANAFQDIMHNFAVTPMVVLLSVASLMLMILGGFRKRRLISLAIIASIALAAMCVGGIGMGAAPAAYFGVFQRFNHFATTGFNAVLGLYLYFGLLEKQDAPYV